MRETKQPILVRVLCGAGLDLVTDAIGPWRPVEHLAQVAISGKYKVEFNQLFFNRVLCKGGLDAGNGASRRLATRQIAQKSARKFGYFAQN